jgi:pSer/pThr/pTyr-binding forkhead associated (FHA) protein
MYVLKHDQTETPLPRGATLKLGRAPSSDIVCDDASASRHHADLKDENGQLSYRDLESTNGSAINGKPARPWAWNILANGDILTIGSWTAQVVYVEGLKTETVGSESRIQRPSVDPAGPKEAFEITTARAVPADLLRHHTGSD